MTVRKLLEGLSNHLIACTEACEAPCTLGTGCKMFKQQPEAGDIAARSPCVHLRFVEFATHRVIPPSSTELICWEFSSAHEVGAFHGRVWTSPFRSATSGLRRSPDRRDPESRRGPPGDDVFHQVCSATDEGQKHRD